MHLRTGTEMRWQLYSNRGHRVDRLSTSIGDKAVNKAIKQRSSRFNAQPHSHEKRVISYLHKTGTYTEYNKSNNIKQTIKVCRILEYIYNKYTHL